MKAPVPLVRVEPQSTEQARAAGLSGSVLLSGVIGVDGRVSDVKVIRPLGMGLDEKAVEALRRWVFRPATVNGVPKAVPANIEMRFPSGSDSVTPETLIARDLAAKLDAPLVELIRNGTAEPVEVDAQFLRSATPEELQALRSAGLVFSGATNSDRRVLGVAGRSELIAIAQLWFVRSISRAVSVR